MFSYWAMSFSAFLSTLSGNSVARYKEAILRATKMFNARSEVVKIGISNDQCDVGNGGKIGQVSK